MREKLAEAVVGSLIAGRRISWLVAGAVIATLVVTGSTAASRAACSPTATILESPRPDSQEVQAKAVNDLGDIVGFADADQGSKPIHAILWKGGRVTSAVDLGVPAAYASSEAYGVNNRRLVFGVVYDKQERTFPFRWANGRMTILRGPSGRVEQTDLTQRNAINDRGEIVATLIVAGNRRAVRWNRNGEAAYLPALPGHTWTNTFGINDDGMVSGWSRKLPSEDGEENPVLWTASGKVVPLETVPGRADGIAEATTHSGLTVGYLGNLGTDKDPESDQFAVWRTSTAAPRVFGRRSRNYIAELIDVNDRGQAIGQEGTLDPRTGFSDAKPVIWENGWARVRPLAVPAASARANPVIVTNLNDINQRGTIVGDVYGLSGKAYDKLRRIDPVVWRCAFGR